MDDAEKVWFREARHVEYIEGTSTEIEHKDDWRKIRERMKTVSVAFVFCLNIGVDPPDVQRKAQKEAWVDTNTTNPQKTAQKIASNLQKIYEKLQPRARYKSAIDPAVDVVKKLCISLRKNAKDERVLFHYNGHGVPKPTDPGEIWVFNKNLTQYVPLALRDLQSWMGGPSVYLWDCSSAGTIVNNFVAIADATSARLANEYSLREHQHNRQHTPSAAIDEDDRRATTYSTGSNINSASIRESIQLGACSKGEVLPTDPDLPADLFTSCLTSPIQTSLLCHILQTGTKHFFPPNIIDEIPGTPTDRRTLLGELNWIFAAITDTIAWSSLPTDVFQRLFRQDLLIASLFRSFLLAERIMLQYGCHVVSRPQLPHVDAHPFWEYWDQTLDLCLSNLHNLMIDKGKNMQLCHSNWFLPTSMKHNLMVELSLFNAPEPEYSFSSFFIEQLQAFEVWLMFGNDKRTPPQQLPVLLQVLLSQAHRVRALELLARFVDLGSWAVAAALSVGIFPYVLKLLQCGTRELRPALAFIWAKILSIDPVCQNELIKDNGYLYFLNILSDSTVEPHLKIVSAFVLAMLIYNNYRPAQKKLIESDYVTICVTLLSDKAVVKCRMLCLWLLIGLGRLWVEYDEARWLATRNVTYERVEEFLDDESPEVRAAAVYALGCFIHNRSHNNEHATTIDSEICHTLCNKCAYDGSVLVRAELVVAIQWFLIDFESQFLDFHSKLDVEMELAAMKKKKHSLNTMNGVSRVDSARMKRSSSSASQSKEAEKSTPIRKASFMAASREESMIMTSQDSVKLRLYEEMRFLNAKTFKNLFERIWLALLRLCFDPYEQVSVMCLKLVNYVLDIATKRKSERVAIMMANRMRNGDRLDVSRTPVENGTNVRFMIGSPGAAAAASYNTPHSSATLSAVENITQQLKECTSVADMVSSGLIETASTNFAPKRNIFGSQSARYSSSSANQDDEMQAHAAFSTEIVSTKFVQWCSKLFTQPIYKTIYESSSGAAARNLLISDHQPFMMATASDWALHTHEGLRQKLDNETLLIKNEKSKFGPIAAPITCPVNISSVGWSYLRPYVYICDGSSVSMYNYRNASKCCEFLAYGDTLNEDNISELLTINGLTHELLITGTDNGLIEVWDPMFSEHSHRIENKPKLITAAYLLCEEPRITSYKNTVNRTLYQWDQNFGRIACAGNVRICRLWDAWAERTVLDLMTKNKNHPTTSIAMDMSCNLVSCGFSDGIVKVYDVRLPAEQNMIMELRHFSAPIVGSRIQPNGQLVAGSSYGDVRVWETRMYCEPTAEFRAVTQRPNDRLVKMKSMDIQSTVGMVSCLLSNGTIRTFDVGANRLLYTFSLNASPSASGRAAAIVLSATISDNATLRFHQGQTLCAATNGNQLTVLGLSL